ncbi:MAG: uroporphyrinogen decarboxylase family protein [Spirochaetales bacterium]
MTSKQRLTTALDGGTPDRLPVTTHHVMPYFTERYLDGCSTDEFFDRFGLDAICWTVPTIGDESRGEYRDPTQKSVGFLQTNRIVSGSWRRSSESLSGFEVPTRRERIETPAGTLTAVLRANEYTEWVTEHLIKEKRDIELLASYQTHPLCDVRSVREASESFGERGIVRGFVIPSDIYGQPGCWQDFCCLRGTEQAIMDTFDDPEWVHEALAVLLERKLDYVRSLAGAGYDLVELGGGDGSTTVISPDIFESFVAPYDAKLIEAARDTDVRIAYHICGGIMPILEQIADMRPHAIETFTPPEMGADTRLAEAKKRIGNRVCMIGGFNQSHFLYDRHVRRDPRRSPPLLCRGRPRRRLHPLALRPLL